MIEDKHEKEIVTKVDRFLMENSIEHVIIKKGSTKILQKMWLKKQRCCNDA